MIVEFYGLPGSGKTTTMNDMIAHARNGEITSKVRGRDSRKWVHIKNALSGEYMYFLYLLIRLFVPKHNKTKLDRRQMKVMLELYLIYMQERMRKDFEKIHCFDHGFVQTLSSFVWADQELEPRALAVVEYVAKKFSDSAVFVYAENDDIHMVYDRIIGRGEARRIIEHGPEFAMELLTFQKRLFDDAGRIFARENCSVVINTKNRLEDNVQYLQTVLKAYKMETGKC